MPASRLAAAISVPWNAFVAAFLYYTLLTLVVLGGVSLSIPGAAIAYLLPVAAYVGALVSRAVHALTAMPVEIAPTPSALLG